MPEGGTGPATGPDPLAEAVATACRVLAVTGLVEHVLGHASVRTGPDELAVRCRGPNERGLEFTTASDVRRTSATDPRVEPGWALPNELPIHTGLMQARPDISAVVHAHPPAVVAMSLAGLPWRPIFGAYDIPATRMAADGIPVWPRACLVTTPELAADLADCLGDRPVAVLTGHGLVSVAGGPPEQALARAVVQAVSVDSLARMTLAVHSVGRTPPTVSDADLALLPDLGSGFTVDTLWRHLRARADRILGPITPD